MINIENQHRSKGAYESVFKSRMLSYDEFLFLCLIVKCYLLSVPAVPALSQSCLPLNCCTLQHTHSDSERKDSHDLDQRCALSIMQQMDTRHLVGITRAHAFEEIIGPQGLPTVYGAWLSYEKRPSCLCSRDNASNVQNAGADSCANTYLPFALNYSRPVGDNKLVRHTHQVPVHVLIIHGSTSCLCMKMRAGIWTRIVDLESPHEMTPQTFTLK